MLAALCVAGAGGIFGPRPAVAQRLTRISGRLEYEAIGSGAAPLGLASLALGESAMAVNLGRLLRGLHARPLPSGGKAVSVLSRSCAGSTWMWIRWRARPAEAKGS